MKFKLVESLILNDLNQLDKELSGIDYAFIDASGKELPNELAMDAVVQSPSQFKHLRKGVCTDFVEYECSYLDSKGIPYNVYYIQYTDEDGDRPSHVFAVIKDSGKYIWFEKSWHSEAGIHKYNSLNALFEDISKKHCIYDGNNYLDTCKIIEIKKSLVGMSQKAIYDYVDTLPVVWQFKRD